MESPCKATTIDKRLLSPALCVFKRIPLVVAEKIVRYISPIDVKTPQALHEWLSCFPLTYARIYVFVDSVEKWSNMDRLATYFYRESSSTITSTGKKIFLDVNVHVSPKLQGARLEALELFTKSVNVKYLQLHHRALTSQSSRTIGTLLANAHRNQKQALTLGFTSEELSCIPEPREGREAFLPTLLNSSPCLLYLNMNRSSLRLPTAGMHRSRLFSALSASKLAFLRLIDTGLDAHAAIALAEVVATHRYLKLLELSENLIEDRGVVAIARGIERNVSLECVGLLTVDMTGIGGCALARALRTHPKMEVFILKDDDLGAQCGQEFASMLHVNTSLQTLVLSYSQLDAGCSHFVKALEVNRTLRSLRLSYSGVVGKDKAALVHAALQGGTLELLEFEDNNVLDQHSHVPFPIIEYLRKHNVST